jgi:two-component system, cell cycle sensor histidine kinase and response regulator CckA
MGNVSGLAPAEPQPVRTTVLVLDDEDSIRRLVTAVLESAGYLVLPAPDGALALDIARSHPVIDLLITDMTMPEMDGRQAADAIRAVQPQCRVLFMSGYPLQVALPDGIQPTDGFIQKPFVPRMLVQRVREILDKADGDRK